MRREWRSRRRELIPTVGLVRKLGLPLSAVSLVMLFFALLLSFTISVRPVEVQDGRVQSAYTTYVVEELAKDPGRLAELRQTGVAFAAADHLLIVDRASGRVVDGEATASELEAAHVKLVPGDLDSLTPAASVAAR